MTAEGFTGEGLRSPFAKKCTNLCKLNIGLIFLSSISFIIFLGELEILICGFVLVCGWVDTEWCGCSFLEELGVMLELFVHVSFASNDSAKLYIYCIFFISPRRGPPLGLGPLGSCLGCLGGSPALVRTIVIK